MTDSASPPLASPSVRKNTRSSFVNRINPGSRLSGTHLAEMDDFFFLKQAQTPDTFTPFVVTASASEKASAGRVLAQGTFNLITTHVNLGGGDADHPWALRQNKLRALIASREGAGEIPRTHGGLSRRQEGG